SAFDGHAVRAWSLEPGAEPCLRFVAAGPDDVAIPLDDARTALVGLGRSGTPLTVRMDGPLERRILVETGPVAGYGWTILRRAADTVFDRPASVTVEIGESGPLRGRATITSRYRWPTHADGDEHACASRAATTTTATIRTAVSLTAGDPVVAVEPVLENRCRDHRLRAHFPLPAPAAGSHAGCAFAVVHRGLAASGGPAETPPPTFPARRFVDCSDGS